MEALPRVTRIIAPTRNNTIQVLREAIARNVIRPGTRLSERQLANTLGVSRATLREALRELEFEGLIQRDERGRLIVSEFGPEFIASLYDVRETLEALAAARFTERATRDEVDQLKHLLEELARAVSENDHCKYLLLKDSFYELLLAGARNPVLETLLKSLQWRLRFLRARSLQSPNRLVASLNEIRAIVVAIRERDAKLAELRTREHIQSAAQNLLRLLESENHRTDHAKALSNEHGYFSGPTNGDLAAVGSTSGKEVS